MIYLNGTHVEFITFPNNEKRLDLPKDVLIDDNIVVWRYETDASIFELFLLDDAMKSYGATYKLFIGYMPYSRMDRVKEVGTAFSLDVLVQLMTKLKALKSIEILDPHSPITLEKFKEHGIDASESSFSMAKDTFDYTGLNPSNAWVVFPDKGAAQRYDYEAYPNVIICEKVRNFETGKIESIKAKIHKETKTPSKDAPIIIIDDLCSYGGTFVGATKAIETDLNIKSQNNWLIVTHAERAIDMGQVPITFNKIFTTDSIAKPQVNVDMSEQEFNAKHQVYVRPILDIIK